MEYAKKMALVEPRLLEGLQWQQQQQLNPVMKAMTSLDRDMQDVLGRQDMPTDEKVKLYNQVLHRYVTYKDQQETAARAPIQMQILDTSPPEQSSSSSSAPVDGIEQEVMESVPTKMKKKARLLLTRMKNSPHLRWTDKGELIYKDQVMTNTNVADLVNDALRRRKHFEPHGWQTFAHALKETNVPQDLVGHRERWQWMQQQQQQQPQEVTKKRKKRVVATRVSRWAPY
jgi:hypothetical protein